MTRQTIQGVLFDMDGVLCDSEPYIREAACAMFLHRHQAAVRPDEFKPFAGTGEDRFLGGVAEIHGVTLNMPDDKDYTYQMYLESIAGRLQPLEGAVELVRRLRQSGIKQAVASSADWVKVEGNLKQIGLPPAWFDAVVCGSDVVNKKPDPEIFLLAAERIGLRPEQCLVVEDAPNGLAAAGAAGCPALGITTSFDDQHLINHGARWTCPNLGQLPQALLNLLTTAKPSSREAG